MQIDPETVKSNYKSILIRAKIASAVFVAMMLPNILARFVDFEGLLGLDEWDRIWMMLIGFVVFGIYFGLFYKCPQCSRYPGSGWSRNHCESCGVELRDASE